MYYLYNTIQLCTTCSNNHAKQLQWHRANIVSTSRPAACPGQHRKRVKITIYEERFNFIAVGAEQCIKTFVTRLEILTMFH